MYRVSKTAGTADEKALILTKEVQVDDKHKQGHKAFSPIRR